MQKVFQYHLQQGIVWKIIPDNENTNQILVEIRQQVLWQTQFLFIDVKKNIFFEFQLPENWWISPVLLSNNKAYFYFYANSEKPIPTELWVFDLLEKKIITQSNDIEIDANITEKKNDWYQNINYYEENEEYFETLSKFIKMKNNEKNINVIKNIGYIENNDNLIINFFSKKENILHENLWITDKKGNIIYEEKNSINENFYIGERIYMLEKKLLYLKQKTEILIYQL